MKSIFIECNNGVVIPAWILDGRLWVMDGHGQTIVPVSSGEAQLTWWARQDEILAVAEQIQISYDGYLGLISEESIPKEKNIHITKLPDFWPCPLRVEKMELLNNSQQAAWHVDCANGHVRESAIFTNQVRAQLERAAGDPGIGVRDFADMLPKF